jgi:hypothetical protein
VRAQDSQSKYDQWPDEAEHDGRRVKLLSDRCRMRYVRNP